MRMDRQKPPPDVSGGGFCQARRPVRPSWNGQASISAVIARVTFGSTGMPGPMDVVKVTFLR